MGQYFKFRDQDISVGDTITVHQEVTEGDKKRIQIFEGIVIVVKNRGNNKSFTVRKIGADDIGVEKIFPVQLPSIIKIAVKRRGQVHRAKLYYLRERIGKQATRVKEKNSQSKTAKST
ncbi:50S ribosomal protein L19 [Patescibacteria group bacterium]|nr:50S ribosomal protein L19 [Patescibacteria group bacterium]MBU1967402.1 50S ribosomal protein L19 [Patescibacteria group bacterium]